MTYKEASAIWEKSNRGKNIDPETKKQVKAAIFNAANKRIARATPANRPRNIGEELLYESSPMRLIRDNKSRYYLPEGRFTSEGLSSKREDELITQAAGFLTLKTTTIKGASDEWKRVKAMIKKDSTNYVKNLAMNDLPVIGGGDEPFVITSRKDINARSFPDKAERAQAIEDLRVRNQLIKDEVASVMDYVNNMTAKDVSDFYKTYRTYLTTAYKASESWARKKIAGYDSEINRPENVLMEVLTGGYDIRSGWHERLAQARKEEEHDNLPGQAFDETGSDNIDDSIEWQGGVPMDWVDYINR